MSELSPLFKLKCPECNAKLKFVNNKIWECTKCDYNIKDKDMPYATY